MRSRFGGGSGRWIWVARVMFAVCLILLVAGVTGDLLLASKGVAISVAGGIFFVSVVLTNGIVGLLIISKHPRHTLGWLLLVLAGNYALGALGIVRDLLIHYVEQGSAEAVVDFLGWLGNWSWLPLAIIPVMFIPLYFPDGRLLSKRWRFAPVALTAGLLAGMVSWAIHPAMDDPNASPNPYMVPGGEALADLLWSAAFPLFFVGWLGAIGSVLQRYRRAGREERAQMKWVFYLLVLYASASATMQLLRRIVPGLDEQVVALNLDNVMIWMLSASFPIVLGIAILRHRLYDIDIIIRRTLVYSLVTLSLAVVYFGSVLLLQRLFAGASGQESATAIVLSTLLIAALFSPLRERAQAFVDRRFYRAKYDANLTLARFAETARDEVEMEALTAELVQVIEETMRPETVAIWMRQGGGDRPKSL